jgi:hypothetical protein
MRRERLCCQWSGSSWSAHPWPLSFRPRLAGLRTMRVCMQMVWVCTAAAHTTLCAVGCKGVATCLNVTQGSDPTSSPCCCQLRTTVASVSWKSLERNLEPTAGWARELQDSRGGAGQPLNTIELPHAASFAGLQGAWDCTRRLHPLRAYAGTVGRLGRRLNLRGNIKSSPEKNCGLLYGR